MKSCLERIRMSSRRPPQTLLPSRAVPPKDGPRSARTLTGPQGRRFPWPSCEFAASSPLPAMGTTGETNVEEGTEHRAGLVFDASPGTSTINSGHWD